MARGKVDTSKVRVIAVYNLLKRGRKVSCTDIIRHLECNYGITADRKTIISDLQSINMLIPIIPISGRYGGYRLFDVYGGQEDGR